MTEAVTRREEQEVSRMERLPVYIPPADVYETPDSYVLTLDMPGVAESDVDISVEEGVLIISARRTEGCELKGRVLLQEWEPCRYERSFSLAGDCDTEKIEAVLRNGVLRVTIPKVEAARPKKIQVRAE